MALKNVLPNTKLDQRERGPWHPATKAQKPVHQGWYEVRGTVNALEIVPRFWNGKDWCMVSEGGIIYAALIQRREWRGLAEKPE